MGPTEIAALVAAVAPFIVTLLKKLLKTEQLPEVPQKLTHKALPLVVGLLAGILSAYAGDPAVTLEQAVLAGLAGGAGASYARDLDKNLLKIVESASAVIRNRKSQ